jgi:hypothetical protein
MRELRPKEQHELLLANADKEAIVRFLAADQDQEVTKIAVLLARQCDLFVHFLRLWKLRVSGLDQGLSSEGYTRHVYLNRQALYKELIKK